jgi:hypothetical protein
MMKKVMAWLRFLLGCLGLYQKDIAEPQQEQESQAQAKTQEYRQEVDRETEQKKSLVDGMSKPELDTELNRLRR